MTCYDAHPVGEVEREMIVTAPKVDYVDTNTMSLLPEQRNISVQQTVRHAALTDSVSVCMIDRIGVCKSRGGPTSCVFLSCDFKLIRYIQRPCLTSF